MDECISRHHTLLVVVQQIQLQRDLKDKPRDRDYLSHRYRYSCFNAGSAFGNLGEIEEGPELSSRPLGIKHLLTSTVSSMSSDESYETADQDSSVHLRVL